MEDIKNHPLYGVHNLDTAMGSLWDFYKKRFVVLVLTSFIMALAIQLLTFKFDLKGLSEITDPMEMFEKLKGMIAPMLLMSLVNLIFTVILQYYIIFNPVDSNINILKSIYKSMRYFFPYLTILILFAFFGFFALVMGILVLIIGVIFAMLYLLTIYMFILPVLMVEGNNIGHAISRTLKLSHSGFWANIGWVSVLVLILLVFSIVASAIIAIPFTGSFLKMMSNPGDVGEAVNYIYNPVFVGLTALVNALTFPFTPIFAAILYFNGIAREEAEKLPVTDVNEPPRVTVEDLYAKPLPDEKKDNL